MAFVCTAIMSLQAGTVTLLQPPPELTSWTSTASQFTHILFTINHHSYHNFPHRVCPEREWRSLLFLYYFKTIHILYKHMYDKYKPYYFTYTHRIYFLTNYTETRKIIQNQHIHFTCPTLNTHTPKYYSESEEYRLRSMLVLSCWGTLQLPVNIKSDQHLPSCCPGAHLITLQTIQISSGKIIFFLLLVTAYHSPDQILSLCYTHSRFWAPLKNRSVIFRCLSTASNG